MTSLVIDVDEGVHPVPAAVRQRLKKSMRGDGFLLDKGR
jgi:hypothetical protein